MMDVLRGNQISEAILGDELRIQDQQHPEVSSIVDFFFGQVVLCLSSLIADFWNENRIKDGRSHRTNVNDG
jgi:hypothetical protein